METAEVIEPQLLGRQNHNIVLLDPPAYKEFFSSSQVRHLYV